MRNLLLICSLNILLACSSDKQEHYNWSHYLGDSERSHFTTLDQINAENLTDLKLAWIYESPDTGQMQMNPIIVDGLLYGVTAALKAFALDAATGDQVWIYGDSEKVWHSTSRGVSYWEDGDDRRILFTRGDQLIALNATTGEPIKSFGEDGKVDLHTGLPEVAKDKFIISNTPGAIYNDLIILPYRLSEGADAAPGDIRAFNILDGSLEWTFHVIPHPGEAGYETWENKDAYKNTEGIGAGNNWAGITVDHEAGILYIPTGSLAPDFYGGNRPGTNLYANCLLALHAADGKLKWHQQLTHHDIWDRDPPAPPNLLEVMHDGRRIQAVAQPTKQGYIYVYNKETGEPLFPINEVSTPASKLEKSWPTQPIPSRPAPFSRLSSELSETDVSPYAPNQDEIKATLKNAQKDLYSPPDTVPTLLLPGYDGGVEWGGAGTDPGKGIMYINSNEMAWILEMEETNSQNAPGLSRGAIFYDLNCSSCHGTKLEGNVLSGYPALAGLGERMGRTATLTIIKKGKGMMPGFESYSEQEVEAVADYILGIESDDDTSYTQEENPLPYKHTGYHKFLDANGLPAISPPWGRLSAIDLNTGDYLWQQPFGEVDSLEQLGHPSTGTENYGGPIITENGLLIIAATKDGKARIYNRHNGDLLWSKKLPAASFATPATYEEDGTQFIVFACGGEKLGTAPGNKVVAFAIKNNSR